jgi:hypothetical protein
MKLQEPIFSNCLFGILFLILSGRVKKIAYVSAMSSWWKYHFVALTRNGHALHFASIADENPHDPVWFAGKFEGVGRVYVEEELRQTHRQLIKTCDRIWWFFWFWFFVVVILSVPWLLGWFFYSFWFCGRWSWHAIKSRKKR